jgi:serine/threonine protein kinase
VGAFLCLDVLGYLTSLSGNLKKRPPLINIPYGYSFKMAGMTFASALERKATADIMSRCLRLDPDDRASAEELLKDPWFADVEVLT